MKRVSVRVAGAAALLGTMGWVVAGSATSAFADSQAYELYCPGTPVGNIALNGVVTTATVTPASPASGTQFQITNYQTTVNLPNGIVTAAAALGNTSIAGSATTQIDVTGATPATLKGQPISFSVPIPNPVPASGVSLSIPSAPGTAGPFTASGGPITVSQDAVAALSLTVSGSQLALNCTAYPNNATTTGIGAPKPTGTQLSPQIAMASAGGAAPASTPTTAAPAATATTVAPVTSPSSNLAYTGTGPGVVLLGEIGLGGILAAALVMAGYRARSALAWVHRGDRRQDAG